MKRKQQMFRGCPYEDCFSGALCGDCRNCPNYDVCVDMMRERKKKAKAAKKGRNIFRNRVLAIVALVALATTSLTVVAANKPNEVAKVSPSTEYTVATSNEVVFTTLSYKSEPGDYTIELLGMSDEVVTEYEKEEFHEETLPIMITPEISAEGPGKLYYYDLNERDKLYIAMMVYKEARGESFEGKVAVAAVALNRYVSDDRRFNRSSIYAIITQPGQFADISGVTQGMLDSVPECMEAVEAACKGWDPTRETFPEGGALFFYSPKNMSEAGLLSRSGVKTHVIGNHNFHVDFNPNYAP